MGCIRHVKRAAKELRKQITPTIMQTSAQLCKGFALQIADGDLTKAEAHETGRRALAALHGIKKTTAGVAMDMAYQATVKLGAKLEEMGEDDSGTETDPLE